MLLLFDNVFEAVLHWRLCEPFELFKHLRRISVCLLFYLLVCWCVSSIVCLLVCFCLFVCLLVFFSLFLVGLLDLLVSITEVLCFQTVASFFVKLN